PAVRVGRRHRIDLDGPREVLDRLLEEIPELPPRDAPVAERRRMAGLDLDRPGKILDGAPDVSGFRADAAAVEVPGGELRSDEASVARADRSASSAAYRVRACRSRWTFARSAHPGENPGSRRIASRRSDSAPERSPR